MTTSSPAISILEEVGRTAEGKDQTVNLGQSQHSHLYYVYATVSVQNSCWAFRVRLMLDCRASSVGSEFSCSVLLGAVSLASVIQV